MDMSLSKESKVFIFGAGCSADCGYPLGKGLAAQLEEFHSEILGRFPIIERCVRDTINLANGLPQFDTLDQLAKHAEETFSSWRQRKGGIVWDKDSQERQNLCDKQIMDAKIAVSAMFLAREERAKSKGLPIYERFIASIFGGEPWEEGVKAANCHVLTFNYDRLFEIAFLEYFKSFDPNRSSLYGRCVLNAGFNQGANGGLDKIEPVAGQFSFLKLHGSAGWWVWKSLEERERRRYWPAVPTGPTNMHDIEALLQRNGVYSNDTLCRLRALPWEPLITFPHESSVLWRAVGPVFHTTHTSGRFGIMPPSCSRLRQR